MANDFWYPQVDVKGLRRKLFDNYGALPPPPISEEFTDPSFIQNDVGQVDSSFLQRMGAPSRSYQEKMDELYTPSVIDRDRLRTHLDTAPVREEPGIARRLVASGIGLGSQNPLKDQEDVMYAPHMRAMKDWSDKVDPYYKGATIENSANSQERQLANNVLTNESNMERWAQQNDVAQRRLDLQQQKQDAAAEVAKIRAEAYDFKMRHPTWIFNFSGPDVIAVSPDGSQRVNLGPTGHLSDADKINLNQKNELERIEARGREAQETRATVPGGSTANRVSILDQARLRNSALESAYQTDPVAKQYVKKIAEGKYDFNSRPVVGETKPGTGYLGFYGEKYTEADVAAYDEFRQSVDPNYKAPTPTQVPTQTQTQTEPSKPAIGPTTTPAPPKGPRTITGGEITSGQSVAELRARANRRREFEGPLTEEYYPTNTKIDFGTGGGASGGILSQRQQAEKNRTNPPPPEVRPGKVYMVSPDGKQEGYVPEGGVAEAEKNGWRRK